MHPTDTALNDFIDGSLGLAERSEIDQHLAACATCRQTVDDLREILRTVGELEPREAPIRAWSRLERAIRMEREHATSVAPAHGTRGAQATSGDAGRAALLKGRGGGTRV